MKLLRLLSRRAVVTSILFFIGILTWALLPISRFVIILPLLLFGPGYLIEQWLFADRDEREETSDRYWFRPALWIGLSFSVVALIYEWVTAVGLSFPFPALNIIALSCVLAVLIVSRREYHSYLLHSYAEEETHKPSDSSRIGSWLHSWNNPWVILVFVFLVSLWLRFIQIEGIVLPLWVDSVHHALMIRVAAEQGVAPLSLQPYLPVEHLPYHWGYHVFTATVVRLTSLPITEVMLWEGQVLNALHVVTCAALGGFWWRNRTAGIVAGVVVGLVSFMPSYFTSWGRYTHLTGLLITPSLAIAWQMWLRSGRWQWGVAVALLLAGLSMTHFLVLVLSLLLLAVVTLHWSLGQSLEVNIRRGGKTVLIAVGAMALSAPWLMVLVREILLPAAEQPETLVSGGDYVTLTDRLLWGKNNHILVAIGLFGAWLGVWRRSPAAIYLVLWLVVAGMVANPWTITYVLPAVGAIFLPASFLHRRKRFAVIGLLLLGCNPFMVNIPYQWLITNDVITISLFLPLSIMIGGGLLLANAWFTKPALHLRWPSFPWKTVVRWVGICILLGYTAVSGWKLREVINQETILATPADVEALEWIEEHMSEDVRFLVNAVGWYPDAERGSDGGYWIVPYTDRWASTPPAMFTYGDKEYVHSVQEVTRYVRGLTTERESDLHNHFIPEHRFTHIYIGPNTSGPLWKGYFENRNLYTPIYEQDGVIIFAVNEFTNPNQRTAPSKDFLHYDGYGDAQTEHR
jgi:hypothetical protein